ncbi:hypothetical protein [Pseudomonas putida]|uniref:Molecular chaperone DnaJ n=1 Tax=Pseudomonas putida TaxID=303 RepID=A0A7W2QLU3_PSEPU|nr:hypothetical protein [Pseudomonas putida]MBA6119395.1 hypothetical protein [Pseudomonas putida]
MPTENRSSNTEMVSVPRQQLQAWQERFSKAQMFQQSTEIKAAIAQPASQPDAEPIAWMVGTAFWWTKEEAERDAVATGLPIVGLGPMTVSSAAAESIPEGYCIMPRRLTAENGAKALLLGEFKLEVTRECPECLDLDEPAEGCEICDGAGEYGQCHMIPWDKIKFIYSEAVKGLALKQ